MSEINYREFTFATPFLCRVQDGNIYDTQGNHIGVSLAIHKESLELLRKYKAILEEHGIIKREKSPAELQEEMQASVSALTSMVKSLSDKIERLEGRDDKQGNNNGDCKPVQGKSIPATGK